MELILKQDVEGLGFKDDVVTVKNGYGRNFLIPGGKAILATTSAKKVLAETIEAEIGVLALIGTSNAPPERLRSPSIRVLPFT